MATGSIKRTGVKTKKITVTHGTITAGSSSTVTTNTDIPMTVEANACVVGSPNVTGNYNSNINVWAAYISKNGTDNVMQLISRIRNSGSTQATNIEVSYVVMYPS